MNKRFKELAKQAGLQQTKWADADTEDERVRIWQESLNNPGSLEKFAELIVRECSKVIVNGGYRNPAFGEKHPVTPPEIATMIEEHFGVEE